MVPDEPRRDSPVVAAFLIAFAAAFILGGYEFLRSPTNTLYMHAYGKENLPMVMAIIPLSVAASVYFYARLLSWMGPRKTLMATSLGSAALIALAQAATDHGVKEGIALLWLFRNAYVVIIIEQYWSFLNSSLSSADAKKYNGPICGVASLGAVAAGALGAHITKDFGTGNMVYIAAAATVPAALFSDLAYRRQGEPKDYPGSGQKKGGHLGLSEFKRFPVLILILAIIVATQIVAGALTLAWQGVLNDTFPIADQQTAYSYGFYAWLNGLAAALQFVVAPVVMHLVSPGIVNILIPILHVAALSFYLREPSIQSVSLAYMLFKVVDYSVFRASKEALYIPLPFDARYRAKEVIDVFGYRFSKGLTAGAITLMQEAGFVFLETSYAVVAIGACGLWAVLAVPLALFFGRGDAALPGAPSDEAA